MANAQTKARLEVLKVRIAIETEMVSEGLWKETDSPHMHDYSIQKLNTAKTEYLETLREILVPNKTYIMDMSNPILQYDEENNIIPFLYKHMVYGEYKTEHEDFLYDSEKPFLIHRYSQYGGETMDDNRAEIIECLHCSPFTFYVDDEGNTIINGRPEYDTYDGDVINVKVASNIFDTEIIANISLSSL